MLNGLGTKVTTSNPNSLLQQVSSDFRKHFNVTSIKFMIYVFCFLGAFALFQLQEEMKKQMNGEVNYTEEELEEYLQSHKRVMVDSLWKLNVADIEATLSRVCQLVLQDPDAKREELRARARGLKTLGKIFQV